MRTTSGEILLRTKGQAYRGDEFSQIVLRAGPDGTRLLLGDVATVVDGFAETDQAATFDGEYRVEHEQLSEEGSYRIWVPLPGEAATLT